MRTTEQIKAEIAEKFGFIPPFFSPAEQTPQVLENLWQQTLAAYVNNPLAALFKEKLSAYLSRYCAVPYCMICHSCTLRPLGMKAREVLELLESPPPTKININEHLGRLAAQPELLKAWPESNSPLEESLLYCAIFIALEQDSAEGCRQELRRILGAVNYQHLVAFIAYVKTCLVWMEAYPEVAYEADKRVQNHLGALLEDEPCLADFFRNYRERVRSESQRQAEQLAELARKRNEEALRQAAAENLRLARAVASASDGVLITDPTLPDNPIIYTNPAVSQITGYQPDEIIGHNCRFLQGPGTDSQTVAQIRSCIVEQREIKATLLNYRKNGQPFWNELKISPVFSDEGELLNFVGIQTDITERKRAQEALRKAKDELEMRVAERTAQLISVNRQLQLELEERKRAQEALRVSQARFAGILDIADDAIISVDATQRITLFNQGAEKIFGYSAAEVLGQSLELLLPLRFDCVHRQYVVDFTKPSGKARRIGEHREIFARRKDGTEFPAEASISKLELGEEKIFTVILRDITEGKQAEEALEQLSRQNELILNSVGEGLCCLDLQGRITFVNPAAAKLLRYRVEELIGQSIYVILPHTRADGAPYPLEESPIYASLRNAVVHQVINEVFWRQDVTSFPVEYVSTPIREKGEIVGAVIAFKDITERQIVERMKDEFISVVSHELRTPLTSIHGALGMLASGLLNAEPETGKRLLEIAVDSTERLMRLINDILDIERIESGKIQMAKQACNAADLITKAVDVMQAMAEKAEVILSVSTVSAQLWVDPDRIIQTFTNLLSNAIKFSPQGASVWLTAESQGHQILFQVKDQGRGIPADKLETIFERFQQVDASDSRNNEGTGLGLAICRSIVQQHGGRIWVESTLGEGSTFYFTLPRSEK
jgi:PAS domain S-box-containing protein